MQDCLHNASCRSKSCIDSSFNSVRFQVSVLLPADTRTITENIVVQLKRREFLQETDDFVTVAKLVLTVNVVLVQL